VKKTGKMENIEQTERDMVERSHHIVTLGEYFAWLQRCEEFIKQFEERSRVKRPRLLIGNRQSLVAKIARLEGAKTRLQRRFIPMVVITVVTITRKDSFGERSIPRSITVF